MFYLTKSVFHLSMVESTGFQPIQPVTFSPFQDKWPYWASPLFTFLTDRVHKATVRFLNRPGLQELRRMDEKLYLVTWVTTQIRTKKDGGER